MASIQLASGRFFNFERFGVRDIRIEDIAAATSKICRFTGHCKTFYSVAQHQVLVSTLVPPEYALAALLHDATEAYINDLSRPLKDILPAYVEYEKKRLWPVVARAFKLPEIMPPVVKRADDIALVTERRDLMPLPKGMTDEWDWAKDVPVLPFRIKAVDWRRARSMFLARFRALTKEAA